MNIALNDAEQPSFVLDTSPPLTQGAAWPVTPMDWRWAPGDDARLAWQRWARQVHGWMTEQRVLIRDAVVLLPQVALLNHVRQAWRDAVGGWMPRFETVGTLLERLPQASNASAPLVLTMDEALDRLLVGARLAAEPGARRWRAADRAAFDFAVGQMVTVAHAWLKVALAQAPQDRPGWVASTTEDVAGASPVRLEDLLTGPADTAPLDAQARDARKTGGMEQWLLAHALALALESLPALALRRDAVFACLPTAWVAVTTGPVLVPGTDSALMLAMLVNGQQQGVPVCWTPAVLDASGGAPALPERPALFEAAHSAQEAEVAAALVLEAVARARQAGASSDPVALLAQDRVLTRRVRALLAPHERAGDLVMADESGWTLSTTRAAATVTRLLAAAMPQAGSDDWLDWLVEGWCDGVPGGLAAVGDLEAWLRKQGRMSVVGAQEALPVGHRARAALAWADETLAPLRTLASGRAFTLAQGLVTLGQVLARGGALPALATDDAGQSVLKALRLELDAMGDVQTQAIWSKVCSQVNMTYGEFVAWVDETLEGANFMPPPPAHKPDLVITPLTRAVLRPFSAVIAPGADERQLGRAVGGQWLSSAQMTRLGLGTIEQQQGSQWGAWAVLAGHPRMMALARRLRDGEPVAPSPWLSRWLHELGALPGEDGWQPLPDPRASTRIDGVGVCMAAAKLRGGRSAGEGADVLAPMRVSATAYQQLRACPYRYFARSLLGLSSLDELEEGVEASEAGTWLHEVLKRFHEQRTARPGAPSVDGDVAALVSVAEALAAESGLTSRDRRAYFSPWLVTLPALAQHYVKWLHESEADGWVLTAQEHRLERALPLDELATAPTVVMHGVLDRVDRRGAEAAVVWRVMDYKTGSLKGLQDRVKTPQEDTQLAFYAALAEQAWPAQGVATEHARMVAAYLRVADDQTKEVAHPDALASAHALVEGLRADMSAIWRGQAMPALGEGAVCDYCEVRGLCRKDHWSATMLDQTGALA